MTILCSADLGESKKLAEVLNDDPLNGTLGVQQITQIVLWAAERGIRRNRFGAGKPTGKWEEGKWM